MTEQKDHSEKVKEALRTISLLIIGLGVGWLAGLSVSPVATILISGLLGVAIAIVGIISVSLTYKDDKGEIIRSVGFKAAEEISVGLLALIVFGIALGVSLGICARTHNFLGVDDEPAFTGLRRELNELHDHCDEKKWTELGIKKEEVAQRILDKYYPKGKALRNTPLFLSTGGDNSKQVSIQNPFNGFLFSAEVSASTCETVTSFSQADIKREILRLDDDFIFFKELSKVITDNSELEAAIQIICEQREREENS